MRKEGQGEKETYLGEERRKRKSDKGRKTGKKQAINRRDKEISRG